MQVTEWKNLIEGHVHGWLRRMFIAAFLWRRDWYKGDLCSGCLEGSGYGSERDGVDSRAVESGDRKDADAWSVSAVCKGRIRRKADLFR